METRFKGEAAHPHPHPPPPPPHHHQLYNMNSVDLRAVGKRTLEWDLNDWKWDGDLFIATPLNPVPPRPFFPSGSEIPAPIGGGGGGSSNSSSSCSEELNLGSQKEKKESMEKKKRRVVVVKDYSSNDETATLGLNLGRNGFSVGERVVVGNWEESNGKNTKLVAGNSSRSICQVEDCGADLSGAKDYHRRHKVCEMHSKASRALVGNVMQRFCQQCSRFHVLQEFDEGKRSCRRRLAGHNKRRRKTNPGTAVNTSSSADNQNSGYLIISLLKILSNMHSQKSDQAMDQDLLSHLLRSLASSQTNEHGRENLSGLLEKSQNFPSNGRLIGASELASTFPSNCPQGSPGPSKPHNTLTFLETPQQGKHAHNNAQVEDTQTTLTSVKPSIVNSPLAYSEVRASAVGISKVNKFDLNDIFIDSDDGTEDMERSHVPTNLGTGFHGCPSWVQNDCHQSSPPHPSGNSDSACTQSPSSSNGEAQSRTDRIVFKLFGKEPNDFPMVLRTQILDWLSHSPTDIESYIRPGCVILTIYLRQTATAWEELCYDLRSSLNRLLQASDDDDAFWRSGWVYVRIHNQIAFIHHGQVVVDRSLTLRRNHHSKIISVKPIAITASDKARISVRGSNLFGPATRLLCALGGKYLIQKATDESMINFESSEKQDDLQCMSFSCSVPIVNGRGFIEVEDHGLSSSFFPFIVAEEDVCSEIRILETALEFTEMYSESSDSLEECRKMEEVRSQAMDFIDEMGWLLHRSQLKSRLGHLNPNPNLFPLERYKWLVEFSMDRDWCAVLKKLLDILLDGTVSIGESNSLNLALLELGLLHRAVRRNSRSLVEFLLRYTSKKESVSVDEEAGVDFLFRPDHVGPGSLTPLHIAAGKDGSEDVIDALTDDPRMVGIKAWKNSRDSTGFTPEDYARLRGHYSYIHLVQKKINKRTTPPPPEHIVLNIPSSLPDTSSSNEKQNNELATGLEIEARRAIQQACRLCDQKPACRISSKAFVYRPAMLSMVAIAAVCVCVALLFKSSPEVFYVFRPFRWESLRYGTS